jgi:PAS domain-containing protein
MSVPNRRKKREKSFQAPGHGIGFPGDSLIQALVRAEEERLLVIRHATNGSNVKRMTAALATGIFAGIATLVFAGWTVRRDTLARWKSEQALRADEERFGTLANNMSQLAWMADAPAATC